MKLSEKQMMFSVNLGKLLTYVAKQKGFGVTMGECYRTKEQALIYFKQGKGVKNSFHGQKLAVDLNLFINGKYQQKSDAYKKLGKYWKSLNPNCNWGGDFSTRKDSNHFSMFEVPIAVKKVIKNKKV